MKIFDLKNVNNSEDFQTLFRAINYYRNLYFGKCDWKLFDQIFEEMTKCKIGYYREEGKPQFIIFEDEDWFWFKTKWL